MSYVVPTPATTGELWTASRQNTVFDNMNILKTTFDNDGNFAPPKSTLTIASGVVTPIYNRHAIDTQGAASSDDLDTLDFSTTIRDGFLLVLTAENLSHTVTVKNATGNIRLKNGDFALSDGVRGRYLLLMLWGITWIELSRSDYNGASISNFLLTDPVINGGQIYGVVETGNTINQSDINQAKLTAFTEGLQPSLSISGGGLIIDVSTITNVGIAANANGTAVFNNPPNNTKVGFFRLFIVGDGTVRTITWPGSVKWFGGSAPTLTGTNNKVDMFEFWTFNGGTTWLGRYNLNA